MPTIVTIILIAAGAAALLFGLDRLLLWMEGRGWIYYRRRKASPSSLGNAFLEIQSMVEPSRQLAIEAREDRKEQQEGANGRPKRPPTKSGGSSTSEGTERRSHS